MSEPCLHAFAASSSYKSARKQPALFSLLFSLFLLGCGVVAPPVPPIPKIPAPPRDLVAEQRGERVLLRWSVPLLNTDATRIDKPQRMEVFRWFTDNLNQLEENFAVHARSAYLIPEQVLDTFVREARVEFADPLGPETLRQQAGCYAVYAVKALNLKDEAAGFSNLVAVRIYPVPAPIAPLATHVTEQAIELRWAAPGQTTSGTPLEAIAGYHIFRSTTGEPDSFVLIGTAPTARYADHNFQFGETYFYRLRTLAQFGVDTVASDDSVVASVTPRDVFPPPTPAKLVAIASPAGIDLTWDASVAGDLAGYYVYRSEQAGTGYVCLTPAPHLAQSFADSNVELGKTYYYVVTAVDREGNESPFSEEVRATARPPQE